MAPEPENELIDVERERVPDASHAVPTADANGASSRSTATRGSAATAPSTSRCPPTRSPKASPRASAACSATSSPSSRSTPPTSDDEIDRAQVERAFVFACQSHADQKRRSGEDFVSHPVEVAKICAGLRLDTETLCAALLHDTVEDTTASIDEVSEQFGEDVAHLVDGVTKLTGITFESRDESQAENYRKMMVAMASDVRVILIKLADRLHNMRTLGALPKQKQVRKSRETLEIYAPLAHRLGYPRDQVGARGPLVPDPAPAQVRRDQEAGQPAADRARAVRRGRRPDPAQGARQGRDRGRADLRARQALLLDLLEDDEEGPRVQRDLRPDRDARDRRLRQGLLRRRRRHPRDLEAAPGPLQGLHRDPEAEPVPGAAHDRDRSAGTAPGDPDPDRGDARAGRVRRRRARRLQGGRAGQQPPEGRGRPDARR